MDIIYFDLETQRTANDVGGWDKKYQMGMSVGVTYSTVDDTYEIYPERRAGDLVNRLRKADLVVGYNILHFDYQVLMAYTILDLPHYLRPSTSSSMWRRPPAIVSSWTTWPTGPLGSVKLGRDLTPYVGGGKEG